MKEIDFSYESVSGKYEIYWKIVDKKFHLDVTIPNGTEAEIILPNGEKFNVQEGKYNYECELDKKIYAPFSIDSLLLEIINNEKACEIVKKCAPNIYELATGKNEENKLNTIRFYSMYNNYKEQINKCQEELSKLYI